ncbi:MULTISPECIES: GntR family transcriptional regulator [unclassified Mesorhizobium]|uniref:GntR family transcriptional regulator n=1 Tax=unclassified Mesorhizobium TaxID=325217 RepID=UPI002417F4D3|nr:MULTISPECIES: GntR family transcriptional regulator [unclassified Mesorhizobium]WFP65621.1 GntR family transcriptional regulator [Mesorhizobium sp. WSM4904]WFP78885.1 GntR family transcriptional regulator [Mesorhizobium sp. WSM4906]
MEDATLDSAPFYVRIQKDLLKLIHDKEVEPGGRFPSERELSVRFGASRMTMRKAVDHLVQAGALERRGTSGTYVPDHLFDRPLSDHSPYSISDVVKKAGHTPGSKLLFFERREADNLVASKLGLDLGDPVIAIERQRTVDGVPVCLEFSHIPARLVPGLSASDLLENNSLYKVFRETFHVVLHSGTGSIGIHYATKAEAELLDLKPGASVLLFDAVTITSDGHPFEYLRSLNHPDRVSFTINQPPGKPDARQGNPPIRWMFNS